MGEKKKLRDFNPRVANEWHPTKNGELTPENVLPGSNKRVWWLGGCGHEWDTTIKDRAYTEKGCPFCAGRRILPGFNDLATLVPEVVRFWHDKNELTPEQVQPGSHKKAYWTGDCGHTWYAPIRHVAKKGYGCPICAGKHGGYDENTLEKSEPEISAQWHPDNDKKPSEVTRVSAYRAMWLCENSHEFTVRVCDRVNYRTGCPQCFKGNTSKPEKELAQFIQDLGVNVIENDTQVVPKYEADVLCPDQRVAVEYNGLHWHTEAKRGKMYHFDKTEAFLKEGVKLIHVWEDEWRDRRPAVERLLARKLKVSQEVRLNARSLRPGEATPKQARDFLEEFHIQGSVPGSVRLTLEDTNIRALMLFRKRGEGVWDLARYATNGIVRGGFSKLLTRFKREYSPESIVSFADRGVSDGSLYRDSGFQLDGEIPPDYKYVKRGTRYHKFNFRKHRFKSDPNLEYEAGLSERELAKLNNFDRVYDSGKEKWVWNSC